MTDSPVTKTAEQVAADAMNELWPGGTFDGSKWSADSHEAVTIAAAFRNAGLLVSGAPSEEQIERAAQAMNRASAGFFSEHSWRHLAREALTAAGVGSPVPVQEGTLTADELGVAAWAVVHLTGPMHDYDAISSRYGGSVELEPFGKKLYDLAKALRGGAQ